MWYFYMLQMMLLIVKIHRKHHRIPFDTYNFRSCLLQSMNHHYSMLCFYMLQMMLLIVKIHRKNHRIHFGHIQLSLVLVAKHDPPL